MRWFIAIFFGMVLIMTLIPEYMLAKNRRHPSADTPQEYDNLLRGTFVTGILHWWVWFFSPKEAHLALAIFVTAAWVLWAPIILWDWRMYRRVGLEALLEGERRLWRRDPWELMYVRRERLKVRDSGKWANGCKWCAVCAMGCFWGQYIPHFF